MTFESAKLYPKQQEIANAIVNSEKMYHIIDAGRQCGKSFLCNQLLLFFAINNPKWQCCYVSMTYAQSGKLFKELLSGIKKFNIIGKTNKIENSIILKNGSEIYFKAYTNADAIRGYSFDCLIIDEAAFMDDEDFYQVFRPTLAVKGKKCILCSSPRGYNYFYDLYMAGENGENNYASYFANFTTCPFSNLEEIEDARKKLPDKIFRAEYLGEFVEGTMSVFSNYRNCIDITVPTGKYFAAIDVGRQNDFTVLTIMKGRKVVYMNRWNKDTWENIIKSITEQLSTYKPVQTYVEVNGVGDVFFEMLYKELKRLQINTNITPWQTSNVSKANIIEKLINDFHNSNISIPKYDTLLSELSTYEAAYNKNTRVITYNARNGKHDDCVMSLAICNWNSNANESAGTYVFDFI